MIHTLASHRLASLRPADMTSPLRSRVLHAVHSLASAGKPTGSDAVIATLQKQGVTTAATDIAKFMRDSPVLMSISEAVPILVDLGQRRRLREPLLRLAAMSEDGDVSTVHASLRALAAQIDREVAEETGATSFETHELVAATVEETVSRQNRTEMNMGPLDPLARHMTAGMFIIVAGETNAGKSQLATLLAYKFWESRGARVGIVSLEDRAPLWGDKIIALREDVSLLGEDKITSDMMSAAGKAGAWAKEHNPFHTEILDRSDVSDVERAMLRCVQAGCGMVVVDYVQEIRDASAEKGRGHLVISDIAGRLKSVGKRAQIPVICCSQLTRPTNKKDSEPTKFDIKGSGDLENMSDALILLWKKTDADRNTMGKVVKLKSGGERPRVLLTRNRGGMITDIEEVEDERKSDAFTDSWGGR